MSALDEAYNSPFYKNTVHQQPPDNWIIVPKVLPEHLKPMENVRERIQELKKEKNELIALMNEQQADILNINTSISVLCKYAHSRRTDLSGENVRDAVITLYPHITRYANILAENLQKKETAIHGIDEELVLVHQFVKSCLETTTEQSVTHNRCPICMEHEINRCTIPCGHTFCNTCTNRIIGTCPICRGIVTEFFPMFISV